MARRGNGEGGFGRGFIGQDKARGKREKWRCLQLAINGAGNERVSEEGEGETAAVSGSASRGGRTRGTGDAVGPGRCLSSGSSVARTWTSRCSLADASGFEASRSPGQGARQPVGCRVALLGLRVRRCGRGSRGQVEVQSRRREARGGERKVGREKKEAEVAAPTGSAGARLGPGQGGGGLGLGSGRLHGPKWAGFVRVFFSFFSEFLLSNLKYTFKKF
jgi:hypothetical protein